MARKTRKQKIKTQNKRVLKIMTKLSVEGSERLRLRCLLNGHQYVENVFKLGDCVCICCGQDKTTGR
jgi:hypothetical protein